MIDGKLYDLAMAYWDLQKSNYDIEWNHRELLDFSFEDQGLEAKLEEVAARCREIQDSSKPPKPPKVNTIFREETAPVPNNTVIAVVARAIMAGGKNFSAKADGWQVHGDELAYEASFQNAGNVTLTITDSAFQQAFVEGLSLFTLDVMMSIVGHLCAATQQSPTENPMQVKAILTAKQIARYKGFKSYGKNRWAFLENINQEMLKLDKIHINVQGANARRGPISYDGHFAKIMPLSRGFNPFTKHYVPISWQVQPGSWAIYNMSRAQFNFLGKLHQAVLSFDHREQRGAESYAKKLMYSLFVVPGGTHYLVNGTVKSLGDYLTLIGERCVAEDPGRNTLHRSLKRLGSAIDFLVDQGLISTSIQGSVKEYIVSRLRPWETRRLLDQVLEIRYVGPNAPVLLDANTCAT